MIEIDDAPSHHARFLAGAKGDAPGHLVRLQQASKGLVGFAGLFPIDVVILTATVLLALDGVLAGGVHPADGQGVDADLGPHEGICGVLGGHVEGPLRHSVGGQHRHGSVGSRRRYVDDRPGDLLSFHDAHSVLHQKEGRPCVDVHDSVVVFRGRVPERATVGGRGSVDQNVERPEGLVGDSHNLPNFLYAF